MVKKVIILVILLAILVGWQLGRERISQKDETQLVLYGNVDIRELTLGFRVPGRLSAMLLEEGDTVVLGQELATLDKQPFLDEIAIHEAQIRETEARLANAEKNLLRLSSLLKNRSISESDYDEASTLRAELLARLDTVKAQLAAAVTNLNDATLKSPSSGVILTRVREPGSVVGAGETVYTVSLDSPVWVRAYLDEPDLGLVRPGQKVIVTTDSQGRYEGKVGFISPKAEFTPKAVETAALRTDLVYRLRIVISQPDGGLRQGMPVTVTILKEPLNELNEAALEAPNEPQAEGGQSPPGQLSPGNLAPGQLSPSPTGPSHEK
ncbi:MAG: efflux RND transporter periplasmic adaptor subunit [Deltaproteobacteria bacterium]|nr:efflux RND transporter periplasmic adaptor subunit [Deltaproteobacteria bacterium]